MIGQLELSGLTRQDVVFCKKDMAMNMFKLPGLPRLSPTMINNLKLFDIEGVEGFRPSNNSFNDKRTNSNFSTSGRYNSPRSEPSAAFRNRNTRSSYESNNYEDKRNHSFGKGGYGHTHNDQKSRRNEFYGDRT